MSILEKSKYSLGFTTGAALVHESVIVADYYTQLKDWSAVRSKVLDENSFRSRTQSTLKSLYGEVAKRLKHLSHTEISLLASGDEFQTNALVWLAICRQYLLIRAFTLEVVIPQFESARFTLKHQDYDAFFNMKAEWHQNLDEASHLTKKKARQVIFKMMKECGIVGSANDILAQYFDEKLKQAITEQSLEDIGLFPG